ncbi:SDR family oxidoreductase [Aliarcobacter cryaerophilus]|uniref:SDR family NAD(P)-dependent oxidoreductase n=1 Tax=Aliarcobacter TaxID=2321111 RepID=UPI0029A6C965|nr:SDR family oxidoreductase [Aliarcobacter skirrowii]MDX4050853.1 SDR family oxidoreductase [Aliarcobacter skirrowii]
MLSEKIIIVTGASRGIGKSIATLFASHNANLILTSNTEGSLFEFKNELELKYKSVIETYYFDVGNYEDVKDFYKSISKKFKKIDVLINNSGVMYDGLLSMISKEKLHKMYEVNTYGTIYMSQFASRLMMRNSNGSIINMASIMGTNGDIGQVGYSGSKAALIGITKSMSKELAQNNIRVNAIAPGFIDTDMTSGLTKCKMDERILSIKMKRAGTPEEVANVALFLSSEMSSYVTGQVIGVDGGMLV